MPDSCVLITEAPEAMATSDPCVAAGALTLAVVLDQRTVLLFGWMSAAVPERGIVQLSADAEPGTWHATIWSCEGREARHVVAVLQAENVVRAQALTLVLHAETGERLVLPPIDRIELDTAPLLDALRANGADLAAVFDFFKHILTGRDNAQAASPRIQAFLLAFLNAVSVHDGFIEIIGRPECEGLLLQGWSMHLEPGVLDFGCLHTGLETFEAAVACFERPDLLSTACGVVAFMKDARSVDVNGLSRVFFTSNGTYYHLDVVEKRLVLFEQVAAHLKDMVPRLQGPAAPVGMLKRVCRPRFPGHETVSSFAAPLRLAPDVVLHAPGSGIFISGWLLDPRQSVRMVLLKSTGNFYARIDQTWARSPRPDVTSGFASDALFTDLLRPWENQHGFLAFVPRQQAIAADEVHYLEVVLEDESCVFLPLKFSEVDPQVLLRQILDSISIDDPAIEHIVASHLGPLVSALTTSRPPAAPASAISFGRPPAHPRVSAIVPLSCGWANFDINLARFAGDPDFRQVELIVVAPQSQGSCVAQALRRYGPFYDAGGVLVLSAEPLDFASALEAGSRFARAEQLLFLSPSVFPQENGWLGRLIEVIETETDAAAASPTLLYEDDFVRFAGGADADHGDDGVAGDRFRGYGRHWLHGERTQAVSAGTAECCLVRKNVFQALAGFSHEFLESDLRNRDFGLRLQGAGGRLYWVPSLRLYAADDDQAEPQDHWTRVRRLIDAWSFANKWSPASVATSNTWGM